MCDETQEVLKRLNREKLLPRLLADKTTGKPVIWATDAYEHLGSGYGRKEQITPEALLRDPFRLMSRADKALEEQSRRTKTHAEVFTPLNIVRMMNDYIDADWFGCPDPFAADRVVFPEGKRWQRYVDSRRLEITCGEAPFLVTRYDASTGESIDLKVRTGLLDRKLRVVDENVLSDDDWLKWTFRAFESVYGYEFQGDSILMARLNLVLTFEEHMRARLNREPSRSEYLRLLRTAAWNIWQMDGLTYTIPFHRIREDQISMDLGGSGGDDEKPEMSACRIFDWRRNRSLEFMEMRRDVA